MTPVLLGKRGDPQFTGAMNFIGRVTLRQAAAVLERCDLFMGNREFANRLCKLARAPV
jgi:hypothetical protein